MTTTNLTLRLAITLAASALLLPAQQQPQILHITYVKVQPGMGSEWREMQQTVIAANKKAGTPWRDVWSTNVFGEPTFVTIFPVGKMERYDSPNPVRKMMNDTDYARFVQKMGRIVGESRNVLVRTRPDLSIESGNSKSTRAVVTTIDVVPGKQAEFEAFVKADLKPAWQKAGLKDVWVHQTMMGGSLTEYTIVGLFDKWAEMNDGSPLERSLGMEGMMKLRAKSYGLVNSISNMAAFRIADLSYAPAQ